MFILILFITNKKVVNLKYKGYNLDKKKEDINVKRIY